MVMILTSHSLFSASATRLMMSRPSPNRTTATRRARTGCVPTWFANIISRGPVYGLRPGRAPERRTTTSAPSGVRAEVLPARQLQLVVGGS